MNKLFENIPDDLPEELFDTLVKTENVEIERIVSRGHSSPAEGWYDQGRAEFVLLLKGRARLKFEDGRLVSMEPGDWIEIPAGVKHRVDWTKEDMETIWLAVHYQDG